MSRYLWIDLLAFSVPFLFSLTPWIGFRRRIPRILFAFSTVGLLYLVWDYIATAQGVWGFTPRHLMGYYILGLPLEEILFFLFIPFSCLFIYENLRHFLRDRPFPFPRRLSFFLAALCIGAAVFFFGQSYTRAAFFACALFFILAPLFDPAMLRSRLFWIYIALTYVPFMIVNYALTAPPVVWYNPDEILGVRITTIPLEDFFYSFSMLGFYTLIYRIWDRKKSKKPTPDSH